MAIKKLLKRGFKAAAEKLAKQFRENIELTPYEPLCAYKLAQHLEISVYDATSFTSKQPHLEVLAGINGKDSEWSALTMPTKSGNRIVILNPCHSPSRRQSDLMHELAHIICKHEGNEVPNKNDIPFGLRAFDEFQEAEANWLGATLQLPQPCLLWAKKRNMNNEEIAKHFNASKVMVTYRMNITGIAKLAFNKKNEAS